jgi:hypothetical protein
MFVNRRTTYMNDNHTGCIEQVHLYQLDLRYLPLWAIKNQTLTLMEHLQKLHMVVVVRVETTITHLQAMAHTFPHYALMTGKYTHIIIASYL